MAKVALIIIMTINIYDLLIAGSNLGKELKKSKNQEIEISYLDLLPKEINNKILLLAKLQNLRADIYEKADKFYITYDILSNSNILYAIGPNTYEPKPLMHIPNDLSIIKYKVINNVVISFFRLPDNYRSASINNKYALNLHLLNKSCETVMINDESACKLYDFTTNTEGSIIFTIENKKLVIREKINDEWIVKEPIRLEKQYNRIGYIDEFNAVVLFKSSEAPDFHYLQKPDFSKNLMKEYLK